MVQLVCPICASGETVHQGSKRALCLACGSALVRAGGAGASQDAGEYRGLINDVREAFGSSALGLVEEGRRWATSSGYDDDAPDGEPTAGATLAAGTRLGGFEILGQLGRGGMGIVYRARQASLNRDVALKVLLTSSHRRWSSVRRFRAEAQAVARLHHPNVVPIYAHGEEKGHFYYAMELIDGISLDAAIRTRPEPLRATSTLWNRFQTGATLEDYRDMAGLMAGVADGLAHAHEQGVIHRDIKPHNLLLGEDGRLHITDFGLAYLTDEPHATMSGEVLGTAAYLSPEQIRGTVGGIDHRTDVYSLGTTLYELITRRRPFEGETRDQILTAIGGTEPVRPRRREKRIPRDLETICLRAMEKDPARRYQSAASMADDLRRFAEDRPIRSRRGGPVGVTLKWVRRHRALTAAMMAAAATLVLAAGLIQNMRLSRRTQAASLLSDAYEQLAFLDYRKPDRVGGALEQAASLGADPAELNLAQALARLAASDETAAIEHLQSVLDRVPDDMRAWYMLAWAQWRAGDQRTSLETFHEADRLGGPDTADAWFFRGLAAHFDRPSVAVESYREANALRAEDHEFYPQAVLHLARAYNQRLYVSRTLDSFPEARANLKQLIEHKHYGAYPYYLLSIAHRLAAETLEAEPADGNADLVAHHFAEALEWAREGQLADPTDDRPVTAEAECLETLTAFDEAIATRTRAISLADSARKQWEGHHYRWRLYYWTDQFDAALADLETCTTWSPASRFYQHFYPALVNAQQGMMENALSHARAISDAGDANAQAVLWSATCLRLLGEPDEADDLLSTHARHVDYSAELTPPQTREWVETLYGFCSGETDFGDLVSLIDGAATPRKLRGEAYFHAAVKALAAGEREEAFEHMTRAYRSYDGELGFTFHAKLIWEKMRGDAAWPPWIPPFSVENPVDARADYEYEYEQD